MDAAIVGRGRRFEPIGAIIFPDRMPLLGETESDQRLSDVVEHRLEIARGCGREETAIRSRRTVLQRGIAGAIAAQADRIDDIIAAGGHVAADACQAGIQIARCGRH